MINRLPIPSIKAEMFFPVKFSITKFINRVEYPVNKMGDVNISYETLFELLRLEKTREDLQKLDLDFFDDLLKYLKEKRSNMDSLNSKDDIFAVEQRKKADVQEENLRKILRELYERRERKIINMAVDKSRASDSVIDTSSLLHEEKILYENLVKILNSFRQGILYNLLSSKDVHIDLPNTHKEVKTDEPEEKPAEKAENTIKRIKVTEFVPKFVGTDLEEYGPYDNEDIAELPEEIAELLIDKGSAEEAH